MNEFCTDILSNPSDSMSSSDDDLMSSGSDIELNDDIIIANGYRLVNS